MTLAQTGEIRIEATDRELLLHGARPAAAWRREWLVDSRWWRAMREFEQLNTPASVRYDEIFGLLRDGFRFPVSFGGWSPLTIAVDGENATRYLLGEAEVGVERRGPYVQRTGDSTVWLLDEASWRLLETPDDQPALRRELAVEAGARLCGELARVQIVYGNQPPRRYATRHGWVEQRFVDDWSGPVTPLCGRVGLRHGLPVRAPGSGRVLRRDEYRGQEEPLIPPKSVSDISRAELQAVIACTFVWRGFHVVFPADACWLSDCILAVRDGVVTVISVLDACDGEALREVYEVACRLRRHCPGTYSSGVVVRGGGVRRARASGARLGIRVRDRYEIANRMAGDAIPEAAVQWALEARCVSPGETLERLREARMLP